MKCAKGNDLIILRVVINELACYKLISLIQPVTYNSLYRSANIIVPLVLPDNNCKQTGSRIKIN